MDQRDYGKSKLKAEDDLAKNQEPVDLIFTGYPDDNDGRNNGQHPGNDPAQNGVYPQTQVSFHHNLSSQGPGNGGALPGGDQGRGKQDRSHPAAQQG